jgi:hypothetical protein
VNFLFVALDGINGANPAADFTARTFIGHDFNRRERPIPCLDSVGGTTRNTEAADPAPLVIQDGQVPLHGNGIEGANPNAGLAGDTTHLALFPDLRPLLLGVA